jgi:hypothetical protein
VLIWRLVQHVLIWLAASAVIVVGMTWASMWGLNGHRVDRWPAGVLIATLATIFAAALVQRAPMALVALVGLAALAGATGCFFVVSGQPFGAVLLIVSAIYLVTLGPSAYRWLRRAGS